MDKDITQVLGKATEVNILLNSNMEDVVENTRETSKVCHDIKDNINTSLNEIVVESKKILTNITKETDKMVADNKFNNDALRKILNQASEKSIKDAKENFNSTQRLINSYFSELGSLLQQYKNTMNNGFTSLQTQVSENEKSIKNIGNNLTKEFDVSKNRTDNLKNLIEAKFNELNEAMVKQSKKTRIQQTIYFVLLIIALFLFS